jgi:uncharacterized RDD family membrane protein YckC
MDRYVSVRTPESIAFSYELAGLGSRFLAVTVDMLIQSVILIAIFWGITLVASHAPPHIRTSRDYGAPESVAIAFIVALVFIVYFGYFIAFETLWNGQTPGKKLLGIRVVRDGGFPIDFAASAIRNLIRVGEVALGAYALSAVASIMSSENKRLGDLAAGTIVVRDARTATLAAIRAASAQTPTVRSALITAEEHALIDRFVARRNTLAPDARRRIAMDLAKRVRSRVSYDLQNLSDEDLLVRLSDS